MDEKRRARLDATLNARTAPATAPAPAVAVVNAVARVLAQNNLISTERVDFFRRMFDPRRDIDTECGYLKVVPELSYRLMYDRELGRRVVNVYPEETWKQLPTIYEDPDPDHETPFEVSLDDVEARHHLLHYLQRADELSGIGHYGVILWGLDDGLTLDQPVAGWEGWDETNAGMKKVGTSTQTPEPNMGTWEVPMVPAPQGRATSTGPRKILYIRVLDESLVKVVSYERNTANPRYGLPTYYLITLTDPSLKDTSSLTPPTDMIQMRVHWTRMTHVADNRKTSEVMGTPRQEPVWNRLCDLRKVLGGSGEMFWKGGFPGISLETQPGLENAELDINSVRCMMEDYQNGLQRYLALTGMSAKSLAPQIEDPSASFDVQVKAICITLGVPYRVFMGIEEGVVSGDQATEAWAGRLKNRQSRYVTPMLINPVIQRLIDYGVLAATKEPRGWVTEWPDLMEMSANDKATVAGLRTDAFAKYVQGGVDVLIPPMEFLTTVCGFTDEEAEAIVKASVAHISDIQDHEEHDDGQGEPIPGREPKGPTPPMPQLPGPGGLPPPTGSPGGKKAPFKAPGPVKTPKTPNVKPPQA